MKRTITDIPLDELPEVVTSLGLKAYVADQLVGWLYNRRVQSFDEMTNVARSAREGLAERYAIAALEAQEELVAGDGTRKVLFRCGDGEAVEAVLIPIKDERTTLCVSTQAGCAIGCAFCRTATMGLKRNLTQGEILGQVIEMSRISDTPIMNIVFMGMGEPLMNLNAVCSSIELLLDERAFGMSKRRITLSTAGLIPELEQLVKRVDIKVAISLNATNDEVRDRLMPINRRYPLKDLMAFCREYSRQAKNRITFEYVLIGGVNDTEKDKARLVKLLDGVRAKINLIPFNPFPGVELKAPGEAVVVAWRDYLAERGIQVNIRGSRGQEILAACGQLATKK